MRFVNSPLFRYLQRSAGVPLGYDYGLDNNYFDLTDSGKSVQLIFDTLRAAGWIGDYNTSETTGGCPAQLAGFGYANSSSSPRPGIQDWGYCARTLAVICEHDASGEISMD